jgi:ketosteroid isomerase-like protein
MDRRREMTSDLSTVLAAYKSFASGDASALIDALDPNVEWWTKGVMDHRGREVAARRLTSLGSGAVITGICEGGNALVLEFARPWWKRHRAGGLLRRLVGLRVAQAIWVRNGRIVKVETHEHPAQDLHQTLPPFEGF